MNEPVKLDRTWLCMVVFFDIIEYSRQSLEIQTQWKRRFNQYLTEAIRECPEADRVILDTGDGAAICFLGDPETAMFCALRLVSAIAQEKNQQANPVHVRAGINLGSVKLVKDINGNLNAVGDGINVGQRVMSFAADNQILVSRSFYEVASSLSESYASLFKYEGVRKDKHVREHTLYELHPPNAVQPVSAADTEMIRKGALLPAAQMVRVENNLASIIGPIAKHLVKNACQQAGSATALRQALLAFVPDKTDQGKFLKACGDIFPAATTGAAAMPSSALPPAPSEKSAFAWEPSVLERARKDLAVYIGPMARLLVDRAATKAPTRAALYEMLAADIPSVRDRELFLKQASSF
jgi:class 3 adenylate cyclase